MFSVRVAFDPFFSGPFPEKLGLMTACCLEAIAKDTSRGDPREGALATCI